MRFALIVKNGEIIIGPLHICEGFGTLLMIVLYKTNIAEVSCLRRLTEKWGTNLFLSDLIVVLVQSNGDYYTQQLMFRPWCSST